MEGVGDVMATASTASKCAKVARIRTPKADIKQKGVSVARVPILSPRLLRCPAHQVCALKRHSHKEAD
jgi:hypothetical protein